MWASYSFDMMNLQKKLPSIQAWCRCCSSAPVIREILLLIGSVHIWPGHSKINWDGSTSLCTIIYDMPAVLYELWRDPGSLNCVFGFWIP